MQQSIEDLARTQKLYSFAPYPKQHAFYEAGKDFRERAFFAGNQLGKTLAGAMEVAYHATGEYPRWWPGHKFDRPIVAWVGADTNETSREVIQPALLGCEEANIEAPDMGTGAIPKVRIVKLTTRQAGVRDVVDQIWVRHKSGGLSRIVLKTYDQKRKAWEGKEVDLLWLDEECGFDLYQEALTRTNAAKNAAGVRDGRLICTFTPLMGKTDLVSRFLDPPDEAEKFKSKRYHVVMTIDDVAHYTIEERRQIVADYAPHQREARAYGLPLLGEGRVFPIEIADISVPPFQVEDYWAQIAGIDFGSSGEGGHPQGYAKLAHDRDNDIVYVTDVYRKKGQTTLYHAESIKARGNWIPVAWPHDGVNADKANGIPLWRAYLAHGVKMLSKSACYSNDKLGPQAIAPVIDDVLERMMTGRFKVFATCRDFFDEVRHYHRKDGKIVAIHDDILKAAFYAIMMLRYAQTANQAMIGMPRGRLHAPILEGWTARPN